MSPRGYFYCALTSTLNILLYTLTFGNYLWLEGRVRGGRFRNWLREFSYRPKKFAQPTSEAELVDLIRTSSSVRVFGAAHSFNAGVVSDETLISLDAYKGVISSEIEESSGKLVVRLKGGTRIREASKWLFDKGFAFAALPSHDAQSVAGIISTDVHGTGRDWGFVSEHVRAIRLIDGKGEAHELTPNNDLFRAAVGGIGAAGIISEVVVEAVPRFNVLQKVTQSTWDYVKQNLDRLISEHDHFSLYLFPFTDKCQVNTWDRVDAPHSFLARLREFVAISIDALLAAWFGNLMAYSGLLPKLSNLSHSLKKGTDLVMESYQAYNRSIYHLHQELEFAVTYERTAEVAESFVKLYERMYRTQKLPYTLFELRFTPAGHSQTLIGPGRERRSMWLDLLANDSVGYEKLFAAAEGLMREVDARPHPGKFNESFTSDDIRKLHGEYFDKFVGLRQMHDPQGKFANDFTRRLFGGHQRKEN